ncbi:MAG: tetratricopeptide repeat protein [Candidatus Gastranaerophilales bacterium]|nr:tetratricopeptide repeat protein [Candidatus Gastranaerophilales bacterium]
MKKICLLLTVILFSASCVSAQGNRYSDFFDKLMNKPTAQERLAPVKASVDDALTPNEQAILLYNENNLKAALDVLTAIKEADRTPEDWLLIGNILQDQEKISDAIFMYQRAIVVNPKFYKAYYNLGNIYLEQEKPYLAIENYRQANKADNTFPYAYYNLGCAYLKIGNLRKAKIAFLKAIELKNTEPNFHYNLAYTYKMLNKPKLSKKYLEFYNKLMNGEK